jgi:hypothetical protein
MLFAATTVANSCSVVANEYLITGPSKLVGWHSIFLAVVVYLILLIFGMILNFNCMQFPFEKEV